MFLLRKLVVIRETLSTEDHHELASWILRHMRHSNPDYPNFLSKKSTSFVSFQVTLDNLFKILRSDGVGADSGQTKGISSEENTLWLSEL